MASDLRVGCQDPTESCRVVPVSTLSTGGCGGTHPKMVMSGGGAVGVSHSLHSPNNKTQPPGAAVICHTGYLELGSSQREIDQQKL